MEHFTEAYDFGGRTLVDPSGEKIGTIDDVYADREGGLPQWALVHTGLFGIGKSFVPLHGASPTGEDVRVTVDKQAVKDSPAVRDDHSLSEAEEQRLFEHYGVPYPTEGSATAHEPSDAGTGADRREGGGDPPAKRTLVPESAVGHDVARPTTGDAMTRSEEELRVNTRKREAGRVRLRKYVVTEYVQQTVPVRREKVSIEREPVTEANDEQSVAGAAFSDEEHEVVLHEEELVVEKKVVPKERVRLAKDTDTDQRQVTEQIRKEQIEIDDPTQGQ